MESFKIDINNSNDLVVEDGILQLAIEKEDIAQSVSLELQQFKGQWLLNTQFGTNWFNSENTGLLQTKITESDIKTEIARVVNKYSGASFRKVEFGEKTNVYIDIDGDEEVIELV